MFERATAFSAVVFFILFGIVGYKYLELMEAKSHRLLRRLTTEHAVTVAQNRPTSITRSPSI